MQLANDDEQYGLIHKIFHWAIAVLILALIPVGLGMSQMENSPLKFEIYAMHKSFGLLVLFLGVLRIIWRFFSPPPEHLETHKPWESALASAAHFWLYVCVIGMPLTGWLMSSAAEFPVPFFGAQLPYIIGKDENLAGIFGQAHEILAYTLLIVLALHMAGALKHHVIDKDETLQRMSWKRAGIGLAALIVLIAGASYAVSGLAFLKVLKEPGAQIAGHEGENAASATSIASADTSNLGENEWAIVKDQTKLAFKASLYGSEFEGVFHDVDGTIRFNPDDLANASADIRIDMKNVTTGDADRDSNVKNAEWFDSNTHPQSRFQTLQFEQADGNNYVAIGTLTIRGVALPVTLPFTLDIQGNTAKMKGELQLNRLDFKIGTGQWEDGKSVGLPVKVLIELTAVR